MRFSPKALLMFLAICLLITAAASSVGGWMHVAEAATSVLIILSVMGFFRGRHLSS